MTAVPDEVAHLYAAAVGVSNDDEARVAADQIRAIGRRLRTRKWEPYPWQHPHLHPPGWVSERAPGKDVCDERCATLPLTTPGVHEVWKQRGGRGTGKTEGAAFYVNRHAEGPPCDPRVPGGHRFTIVAPTQPDAVSSCIEGPSGIRALNPDVTVTTGREGTTVRWPNGAIGRILGAHSGPDVERARAWSNVCLWWLEEAAAMNELAAMLTQAPFTLRLGDTPHIVATTTPKNRPEVIELLAMPGPQTWGRTEDADRLPEPVRLSLEARYRGSVLGRQELDGDLLPDVEGALWVQHRPDTVEGEPNRDPRPGIDNDRVRDPALITWTAHTDDAAPPPPAPGAQHLHRVVVSVDPSAGGDDEAGITVVGSIGQHAYPIADLSGQMTSDQWARRTVQAYYDYGAEGIVLEKSGGDNPRLIVRSVTLADGRTGADVPIFLVPTKVGKRLRAEPVSALYEQHRVHHVGVLPGLEDQMTTWVPDETPDSPDRVDALVHGVTFLLIRAAPALATAPPGAATTQLPSTARGLGNTPGRRPNPWNR
jgi:phage terminase large subunit-like protein